VTLRVFVQFDQYAITGLRVNKYDAGIVSTNRWLVGQKLVAFTLQANNIFIKVVGTKTEVMNSRPALF
jgi:hypothetical protein